MSTDSSSGECMINDQMLRVLNALHRDMRADQIVTVHVSGYYIVLSNQTVEMGMYS